MKVQQHLASHRVCVPEYTATLQGRWQKASTAQVLCYICESAPGYGLPSYNGAACRKPCVHPTIHKHDIVTHIVKQHQLV